ncbi:hypothetical protein F5Y17DRAFT_220159 [Xylariaceae sp. FL0594]|nr:hypothetical protein F5Y17DRAFT_220159 [Xylariaceae sp. FL0594]
MMVNLGRSFKPSTYLAPMSRRPAGPTRQLSNMSNSSDVSPLSSPDIRSDDMALSAGPSPGSVVDSFQFPLSPQRPLLRSTEPGTRLSPRAGESSSSGHSSFAPASSKPIAIELPSVKKVNNAPVYTPPAPLSARGDLPGGYFPLHEEQPRIYHPHPFHLDPSKARMKSQQRASKESPPPSQPPRRDAGREENEAPARPGRTMRVQNLSAVSPRRSESTSSSTTPVASYMPLGDLSSPLPMGKYYPSNYERRKDEKRKAKAHRPMPSDPVLFNTSKSESQVPTLNQTGTANHTRNESDAKRRLQQYQRDMIAQATIALNGGNINQATLSSLRSMGLKNVTKPAKPRLAPLGSPGPITPMELDGSGDGYLGARGLADAQAEVRRETQAGEDKGRREGASSPAVELGPSTL